MVALLAYPTELIFILLLTGFFVSLQQSKFWKFLHLCHIEQCISAGKFAKVDFLEFSFGGLPPLSRGAAAIAIIGARWLKHVHIVAFIFVPAGENF